MSGEKPARPLEPETIATVIVYEWNAARSARFRQRNFPHDLRDRIANALADERAAHLDALVRITAYERVVEAARAWARADDVLADEDSQLEARDGLFAALAALDGTSTA